MSFLNAAFFNSLHKRKFHRGIGDKRVPEPRAPFAGLRCLVLDDEFLIALDIQSILENFGAANVVCFSTADDALRAIRDNGRFDLAVLDLILGGVNLTSAAVAAELVRQKTPFVFLTGMHADNAQLRKYSHVPMVEKPYQAQLLLAAIARALSTK
jgi:CheY-like chemotaxis protein